MVRVGARAVFLVLLFCGFTVARAQEIQVNRENRTIAVSATGTVKADAEIAVVELGYHNYAPTHDQAYQNNVRTSDKIIHALLASGLSRASIHTETLHLFPVFSRNTNWTAQEREERQFQARQSWKIRLPVADAQRVVDLAVQAGANEVTNVDWQVKDPEALEAKASAAALAKARTLAESMAAKLGAKLGELIYASNRIPPQRGGLAFKIGGSAAGTIAPPPPPPHLRLFPQRVSETATVYAVFALE